MKGGTGGLRLAAVAALILVWSCQSHSLHSNESELVEENDYVDGDDEEQTEGGGSIDEEEESSHALHRSPQQHQQPLFPPLIAPNVQTNPLRLPNVLNLPPAAAPRWVQPVGNGLPANPNLPNPGQRLILMPLTFSNPITKAPVQWQSSKDPPLQTSSTQEEQVVGRPVDPHGIPLNGANGQRLIILPNGKAGFDSSTKLTKPETQASFMASQVTARPVYPYFIVSTTLQPSERPSYFEAKSTPTSAARYPSSQNGAHFRVQPASLMEQDPNLQETSIASGAKSGENAFAPIGDRTKDPANLKESGRIGVQTAYGRLLLEAYPENFCDMRQYSDEQLYSKTLQRVEYFVANLTCSRYFFECAIGQTFLLNCTSKDQVFDINTVNCNFKYNVKSCQEYDHILHCSIQEECQQDNFACCAQPQQCIPYSKRCDGIVDCSDGEDENNCPSCDINEFPCVKSGRCISWDKRCNGVPDECFDQTNLDEQNCEGCPPEKFFCGRSSDSQKQVCLDMSLRCNGVRDCPGGEDEVNCKSKGRKYLLCENQKQSVSKDQWCDGYEDCLDGSDEKYCVY